MKPRFATAAAAAILISAAVLTPSPLSAVVIADVIIARAEGRAPVRGGRGDLAFQQALDEAFRRNLLEALRTIAPERQSPRDFETWQETILSRAMDFIGSYRILAHEQSENFAQLTVEVEIYRDKLAIASRVAPAGAFAPPVRLLVLADPFPVLDLYADEEIDAGRFAAAGLEAEFARRGLVILSTTNRAPWRRPDGTNAEENRIALAAAEGRRLLADAVLIAQVSVRPGNAFSLSAQAISAISETTLGISRVEFALAEDRGLGDALGLPVRQLAAGLGPKLAGIAGAGRSRPSLP